MADCLALSVRALIERDPEGVETHPRVEIFYDAVSAMDGVNAEVPDAILLDVLLSGPNGFSFLDELASYHDTARIPVILISSLDLSNRDLTHYGVVQVLNKATMTPEDIQAALILALGRQPAPAIAEATIVPETPTEVATVLESAAPEAANPETVKPDSATVPHPQVAESGIAQLNRQLEQ